MAVANRQLEALRSSSFAEVESRSHRRRDAGQGTRVAEQRNIILNGQPCSINITFVNIEIIICRCSSLVQCAHTR
jgi:hypothetical protein